MYRLHLGQPHTPSAQTRALAVCYLRGSAALRRSDGERECGVVQRVDTLPAQQGIIVHHLNLLAPDLR